MQGTTFSQSCAFLSEGWLPEIATSVIATTTTPAMCEHLDSIHAQMGDSPRFHQYIPRFFFALRKVASMSDMYYTYSILQDCLYKMRIAFYKPADGETSQR